MRYIELAGLIVLAMAVCAVFVVVVPYMLSSGSVPLVLAGFFLTFCVIAFSTNFLIKQIKTLMEEKKNEQ